MAEKEEKERVCITGAGGYIASWVVKLLLSKGDGKEQSSEKLEKASENLKLFKADLLDYDGLCAAIDGCTGVFHIASPNLYPKVSNPQYPFSIILFYMMICFPSRDVMPSKSLLWNDGELTSTLTLIIKRKLENEGRSGRACCSGYAEYLKACETARVKKVVVVSSVAAVILNPSWPKDRPKDEECWSDPEIYGPESVENKDRPIIDVRDLAEAILLLHCSGGFEAKFGEVAGLGWKYRPLEETLVDAVKSFQENGFLPKH
ncbi:Cinnamoyl-CoA reductase 2 [Vitis vinifera]|uniref:Cinnamoyl-CoA reductase 2 n=1 Tax=Vitis vinifera TaxID=29760 RepID=A0A438CCW6_VITVI|nr:Cinnamoyl-CoA reductase 2 [Vitis vinifera]